jgi:hypothetical protein
MPYILTEVNLGINNMDSLIASLKILDTDMEIPVKDGFFVRSDLRVLEAVHFAEECLITVRGIPNWDAIDELDVMTGYSVFPLEQDGFGWLIAGIHTERGILTFGG